MDSIKLGWAEEDITPVKKIRLMGQFYERVSEFVETPISVTALAIEGCGDAAVICSCDLVEIYDPLVVDVRRRLIEAGAGELGLEVDKVILNAIHTHNSYTYISEDSGEGSTLSVLRSLLPAGRGEYVPLVDLNDDIMSPEEAMALIAGRICSVVLRAWESRRPAYFAPGFGRVPVAHCRRTVYDDGSALMWGDTNTPNFTELETGTDTGMELIYTFDADKKLTGVIANLSCPAQVLEHRSFVSSDYWGKTKALLREKFGPDIYLLALIGAAGDLCPRDLIRWVEPESPINDPNIIRNNPPARRADPSMFDISGCCRVARRVYNEIVSVYEELDMSALISRAEFRHRAEKVALPLRRVSGEEYRKALEIIDNFAKDASDFDYRQNAALHVYAGTIVRYRYQQNHDLYSAEMHFLRLGDVALVSFPFELFLDYGNKIRARSPAASTFLVELCCGAGGYLPTLRAERGGHYSAYASSGKVGHEGGEFLVRHTLEILRDLWYTDKPYNN
jgi:hypothetical protein